MNEEKLKNIICVILIFIGIPVVCIGSLKNTGIFKKFERPSQNVSKYSMSLNMELAENGVAEIKVNAPTKLSYLSKKEILAQRKTYVDKVFNLPKYKPSEEVFGQIEDDKPWISLDAASCYWNFNMDRDKGVSEESVFLNNPLALIAVEMPYYSYLYDNNCTYDNYFMLKKIILDENNKLITISYDVTSLFNRLSPEVRKKFIFVLNGLNARDFGYQWGYVSNRENIKFKEPLVTKAPYYFLNYIHVGMSCGINGGCNNGSPFQQELNFKVISLPATIGMKLWKEQPKSVLDNSDMNIRLLLD